MTLRANMLTASPAAWSPRAMPQSPSAASRAEGFGELAAHRARRSLLAQQRAVLDRRLATACGSWRQVASRVALLRRYAARAVATRHARHTAQNHLRAWRELAARKRRSRDAARLHHAFASLSRAWGGWLRAHRRAKFVNFRLAVHLLGRWTRARMLRALRQWAVYAHERAQKNAAGEHVRDFIARRCAHRAFIAWRKEGLSPPWKRGSMQRTLLCFLLRGWRQVVARASGARNRLKQGLARLLVHRAENMAAQAIRDWADETTHLRQRRTVLRRAATRILKRQMAGGFRSWEAWAVHRRSTRIKMLKRIASMDEEKQRQALRVWAQHTQEQQSLRQRESRAASRQELVVARALARLTKKAVSSAFLRWSEWLTQLKHQRHVCGKSLARMLKRQLSSAFQSWSAWVVYQRSTRIKMLKRIASMEMNLMAQALRHWGDSVRTKRANSGKARMMLARLLGQRQTIAFMEWQEYVDERNRSRMSVLLRLLNKKLSVAFGTWAMVVADIIAEREAESDIARQAALEQINAMATCFHRWVGLTSGHADRFAFSAHSPVVEQPQQTGIDWAAVALRTNSSNIMRCSSVDLSDVSLPPSSSVRPATPSNAKAGITISAGDFSRSRSPAAVVAPAKSSVGQMASSLGFGDENVLAQLAEKAMGQGRSATAVPS